MKSFGGKHKKGNGIGMKYKMKIGSITILLNTVLYGIGIKINTDWDHNNTVSICQEEQLRNELE